MSTYGGDDLALCVGLHLDKFSGNLLGNLDPRLLAELTIPERL